MSANPHITYEEEFEGWLSATEQEVWRLFLRITQSVYNHLDQALMSGRGITLDDYEVLVHLSEADGRLRMGELADRRLVSRSNLTHHVARLERAGYVRRERCPDDRRGMFAELLPTGYDLLRSAAPIHVASVREAMFNFLEDGDDSVLLAIFSRINQED